MRPSFAISSSNFGASPGHESSSFTYKAPLLTHEERPGGKSEWSPLIVLEILAADGLDGVVIFGTPQARRNLGDLELAAAMYEWPFGRRAIHFP